MGYVGDEKYHVVAVYENDEVIRIAVSSISPLWLVDVTLSTGICVLLVNMELDCR